VYRVGAASSAAMSPADEMEGLAGVIAQAAVHGVRTHATVERGVTITAKQCIAADGAIAGDDVPVVRPVTSIAAVSAREQVAQTGLIAVPPASKDGEKQDRQRRAQAGEGPARCFDFDPLAQEGLSCPATH
jgi:hypothetical protein